MLSVSRGRAKREILVVEDDPDLREAVRLVLETEGYGVRTAGHGIEALDDLRHHPKPCLIVLDLMMPVMNGWEFLNELRNDKTLPDVCVVVTSAAQGGSLPDVTEVLAKPYTIDRLLRIVRRHCEP